jgi:hypothetical protein
MMQAGYYRIPTLEARVKLIRALISSWETTTFDKEAIDLEVSKLGKISGARNHWIHGDWCASRTTHEVVIFDHRAPRDGAGRRKPVKAADIENHIEAVQKRTHKLKGLIKFNRLALSP